jgi:amidophosphoribosyltransferase
VWQARYESGVQLADEAPVEVDVVSNVPESANPAAQGYAERVRQRLAQPVSPMLQLHIPYTNVFTRNAYVGRSFIQPSTALRQSAVARKFGVLAGNFAGKRVVLVDDSIVRGNTMRPIVKLLRDNGAAEVWPL